MTKTDRRSIFATSLLPSPPPSPICYLPIIKFYVFFFLLRFDVNNILCSSALFFLSFYLPPYFSLFVHSLYIKCVGIGIASKAFHIYSQNIVKMFFMYSDSTAAGWNVHNWGKNNNNNNRERLYSFAAFACKVNVIHKIYLPHLIVK